MLCHFDQKRNTSKATHFILFSNTVRSSATSEYVAVLERVGQIEEPASRSEEWARDKRSSAPKMYLIDSQWNHVYL